MGEVGVDRRIAADGAEPPRQLGALFAVCQLAAHAVADARVVEMGIQLIYAAEGVQKFERRFFADAGHARDPVAGVAHQRLEVDQLRRGQPVFFLHRRLVHDGGIGRAVSGGGKPHLHAAADELQRIAVAGGDDAALARPPRGGGERA